VPETKAVTAAPLMLPEIRDIARRGERFAMETTLCDRTFVRHVEEWQSLGYRAELYFLSMRGVELCAKRVAERVAKGGHSIPEAAIRRRFVVGLDNFQQHFKNAVDSWALFYNSGSVPLLIESGGKYEW